MKYFLSHHDHKDRVVVVVIVATTNQIDRREGGLGSPILMKCLYLARFSWLAKYLLPSPFPLVSYHLSTPTSVHSFIHSFSLLNEREDETLQFKLVHLNLFELSNGIN